MEKRQAVESMVRIVLRHYPFAQAVYLFGSYGTEDEWPDSDVDVAVLLPPEESKKVGSLAMSALRFDLESEHSTQLCCADSFFDSVTPFCSRIGE